MCLEVDSMVRVARIFRWTVRIIVLFLTTTMSIVSLLGGLSAVTFFSTPNNILIPAGPITDHDLNINSTAPYIAIPFNITNTGYFDMTGFYVEFRITMFNDTDNTVLHHGSETYGTIPHGQTLSDSYNATDLGAMLLDLNAEVAMNITVSARYSLDLLYIEVNLVNLNVTELLGGL